MISKIDWLSFTVPLDRAGQFPAHQLVKEVSEALYDFSTVAFKAVFGEWTYAPTKGRAPYHSGFMRSDHGCFIYCSLNLPHILIELTGQGCDHISGCVNPLDFLEVCAQRLTRLDLACDMLCATRPVDFVANRELKRFKTHSEFVSETGETCYVGSRSSERYSRVYRYNSPHERAHLLRAEHVCKGKEAQTVARSILEHGIASVVVALGQDYGWKHNSWSPSEVIAAELLHWKSERHSGKTLFWLNSAVRPALKRLISETGFDAHQWIDDIYDGLKGA